MSKSLVTFAALGVLLTALVPAVAADDDEAVEKDRKRLAGTWRAVAIVADGNELKEDDVRKISVVNQEDGTWTLRSGDDVVARGSSTLSPIEQPKTIDFTVDDGEAAGQQFLGIYEVGKTKRRLCFVSLGGQRPAAFESTSGSGQVLVTFEREQK